MRKIIIVFMIFVCEGLFGQTFCHTPQTSSNIDLYSSFISNPAILNSYTLRIYVHVIRRSDGSGGQSINAVNEALSFLSLDFAEHDIFFEREGEINFIDSDTFYSSPSRDIYTVDNHSDGIDIYLFDDSAAEGGRANGVGESSEFYVSGSYWRAPFGSLVNSRVISHEMAHVLFLWHTHHGTFFEIGNDPGQCPELVDGTNSSICGDYISDTPADPHLLFDVNETTCIWNGSGTDANDDSYAPDTRLIMSYTHPDCMRSFTDEQGERMKASIANLPFLQQTVICEEVLYSAELITNDETIDVCAALLLFTIVRNSAILNINVSNSATLRHEFEVELGSTLNINIDEN